MSTNRINKWLSQATATLQEAHIESAQLDAELILGFVIGKDRTWLVSHADDELDESLEADADELLTRRQKREPLAYLTGQKEFYGRTFSVTSDTLIPRPETERLIEVAKKHSPKNVIDIGCGSGCIGITIKLEIPHTNVILSDVSSDALTVAKQNAEQLGADVSFVESDLLSNWLTRNEPFPFDMIVANLPYVSHEWEVSPETDYEPKDALYADDDGLELIKQLIDESETLLGSKALLLLEADPIQFPEISRYGLTRQFKTVESDGFMILLKRY